MAGGYEQVLESKNVDPKLLGQRNTEDHATLHAQVNINVLIFIAFDFLILIYNFISNRALILYFLIKSIRLEQETEKLFRSMYFYVQL